MHVPEGWKEVHLSDISTKISDGLHSTPLYVDESEYFFINGNNLKDNKIIITESTKCVSENEYFVHKKELGERTILMSINGTIGSVAYYSGEKVVLGKSTAYINIKSDVDKDYIFFNLASQKCQSYFESELTGTTIRNLSLRSIKATKIALPSLYEQQKIAQILSTWDKAIEKLEALIAAKQKRKKALMQQLLTGKKRFAGFDTDWKKCKLADIGTFAKGNGITKDDLIENGLPCIRYGEIYTTHHNYIRKFISFIPQEIAKNSTKLQKGDLLFAGSGETSEEIGKCVAYLDNQEAYAGGDIIIFRPFNDDSKYLGYLMNDDTMAYQKARVGQGHSVVHISAKNLSRLHLSLPSIEEQQKIASVLSAADTEIETHQKQLTALKEQKKGLMQQLLTGKKRVKVDDHV